MRFLILFLALAVTLNAHNKSESYSIWKAKESKLTGVFTIPVKEITKIPFESTTNKSYEIQFRNYIEKHILVYSKEKVCDSESSFRNLNSKDSFLKIEASFNCESLNPEKIIYTGLFDIIPSHIHYARLEFENGEIIENLFLSKKTEWTFHQNDSNEISIDNTFRNFVLAGIEHIGGGLDHIAFLLALLLISSGIKETLICISGFTVGHSITLSLAVLGLVQPNSNGIEAFIGLTILIVVAEFVAIEQVSTRKIANLISFVTFGVGFYSWIFYRIDSRLFLSYLGMALFAYCHISVNEILTKESSRSYYRGTTTLLFGMVHGFGFAGFLLETGLRHGKVAVPLFGFNLGVELGQILILLSFVMAGLFVQKILFKFEFQKYRANLLSLLVFGLSLLGTYWFVQRTFL